MAGLSSLDMLIVRCWSAVVARGESGNADTVMAEMFARGTKPDASVGQRLIELRAIGQLP